MKMINTMGDRHLNCSLAAKVLKEHSPQELQQDQNDDGRRPREEDLSPIPWQAMYHLIRFRRKDIPAGTVFPPDSTASQRN